MLALSDQEEEMGYYGRPPPWVPVLSKLGEEDQDKRHQSSLADIPTIHIVVCFIYLAVIAGCLFEKNHRVCPLQRA